MEALLFVESPLQLLNAYEAINHFQIERYALVIRLSGRGKSDEQIFKVIQFLNLDRNRIRFVSINSKNRTLLDLMKLFSYRFRYFFTKAKYVFIGNFESGFLKLIMKQFPYDSIWFLDDGAKTLSYQSDDAENQTHFFSVFDLEDTSKRKAVHNDYRFLKKLLFRNEQSYSADKVLFLGQKIAELRVVTSQEYIDLIEKVARRFSHYEIEYIPHRGEDSSKLAHLEKIPNVTVCSLDFPVELYGLDKNILPSKIVSFYSSALYTMSTMYDLEAYAVRFDYETSVYKDSIDNVYNLYKKNNKIKLIESLG